MGTYGNQTAEELDLSRQSQDEWSLLAIKRLFRPLKRAICRRNRFSPVPVRKGNPIVIDQDEAPRKDTSIEKLARLAPAFGKEGTITAGNAPVLMMARVHSC